MNTHLQAPSWKTWSLATGAMVIGFTVLVTGLALQSRSSIRQQMVDRDGHILTAVATMLQSADGADSPGSDLKIALQTSRLRFCLQLRG